jgi:hypothetical protein
MVAEIQADGGSASGFFAQRHRRQQHRRSGCGRWKPISARLILLYSI